MYHNNAQLCLLPYKFFLGNYFVYIGHLIHRSLLSMPTHQIMLERKLWGTITLLIQQYVAWRMEGLSRSYSRKKELEAEICLFHRLKKETEHIDSGQVD